jgi:hypothetical protein
LTGARRKKRRVSGRAAHLLSKNGGNKEEGTGLESDLRKREGEQRPGWERGVWEMWSSTFLTRQSGCGFGGASFENKENAGMGSRGGAEVVVLVSGHPPGRDGGVAATPPAHTTSPLPPGELT